MERGIDKSVASALFEAQAVMFGDFTLKSGQKSPIYINLRNLRSFSAQKQTIVEAYRQLLPPRNEFDILADVPTAITPIVSSLADILKIPQITPRIDQKDHGSGASIDGVWQKGDTAVLIDDLISTSKSKLEAIEILEENRIKVRDVVVLIDRQKYGEHELEDKHYKLHSFATMPELVKYYQKVGLITTEQFETTMNFLLG